MSMSYLTRAILAIACFTPSQATPALGAGKAAYVDKERFDPPRAIAMVRDAGGVPILAHPALLGMGMDALEKLVRGLMEHGLMGIEAFYTEHQNHVARKLQTLAAKLDLLVSGGSDFHGDNKKGVHLGVGKGTLRVPAGLLEPIRRGSTLLHP